MNYINTHRGGFGISKREGANFKGANLLFKTTWKWGKLSLERKSASKICLYGSTTDKLWNDVWSSQTLAMDLIQNWSIWLLLSIDIYKNYSPQLMTVTFMHSIRARKLNTIPTFLMEGMGHRTQKKMGLLKADVDLKETISGVPLP